MAESWGVHRGAVRTLGVAQLGISCNRQGSRAAVVRVSHCGTKGHCCGVAGWRVAVLVAAAYQEWGGGRDSGGCVGCSRVAVGDGTVGWQWYRVWGPARRQKHRSGWQ